MKSRIILLFLILISSSCSTQILVPEWFDPKTDSNKHNWLDYEGIVVIAENIEINEQHLIFDFEIKNDTDHRFKFDPGEAYFIGSHTPFPSGSDARMAFESKLQKHFALSEDEVSAHFEQKMKSHKRTNLITGILGAGLLALNVAMDVHDMNNEVSSKTLNNKAIRDMVTFGGFAAMDIVREQAAMSGYKASEDLYFLPDEIMEEGVIHSGESFRGKMFFPVSHEKFIRMIIPVGRNEYALDFRWADGKDQRILKRAH